MEEQYRVSTPENIAFTYDVAGLGSRFIAALIDSVIYFAADAALAIITFTILSKLNDGFISGTVSAIYAGLSFLLYWGYFILFELIWAGQSPGKRIMHIRVVRLDGTPPSAGQIVIRNVGRLVDIFPGFYAVGVVTMMLNDQSRRLGDFAAGTMIVREVTQLDLDDVVNAVASTPTLNLRAQADAETLPLNRLTREQCQIARDFILRRANMSESLRARLALQIGTVIARQMDMVSPSHPAQAEYILDLVAGEKPEEKQHSAS